MRHRSIASFGFTLVELLVVVAIVSILVALVAPNLRKVLTKGNQVAGLNNMRQIGVAFKVYTADHEGRLPGRPEGGGADQPQKWPADLAIYIAPNISRDANGNADCRTDTDMASLKVYADPTDPHNFVKESQKRKDAGVGASVNPLSNSQNNTSFIMNGYNDQGTIGDPSKEIRSVIVQQPSQTILLGTPKWDEGSTGHFFMDFEEGNHVRVLNLASYGNGSNYIMVDGSGRFITESEYKAAGPAGAGIRYGDWLWLVDKEAIDKVPPADS